MTTRALAAAALVAGALAAAPAEAGVAVRETSYDARGMRCQGKAATHVIGRRTKDYRTTGDADVVVVLVRGFVDVRAGDDLVCIRARGAQVRGGDGDDRIVVQSRGDAEVTLGEGDDVFRGSVGDDTVLVGASRSGHDVIRTRGGDDYVVTGSSKGTDQDRIALGAGDDFLFVSDDDLRRPSFRGGSGSDELSLTIGFRGDELVVDNVQEVARSGGSELLRWDDFEQFDLSLTSYDVQRFLGGDEAEHVRFAWETTSDASMGAGDDTVQTGGVPPSVPFDGGPGADVLDAFLYGTDITGSLISETIERVDDGARVVVPFRDFEGIEVWPTPSELIGDDGDNVLVTACGGSARGGAGDDTLRNDPLDEAEDCTGSGVRLFGEAGDDVLVGSPGIDELDGGDGADSADGGDGGDTCRAETRLRCEA